MRKRRTHRFVSRNMCGGTKRGNVRGRVASRVAWQDFAGRPPADKVVEVGRPVLRVGRPVLRVLAPNVDRSVGAGLQEAAVVVMNRLQKLQERQQKQQKLQQELPDLAKARRPMRKLAQVLHGHR